MPQDLLLFHTKLILNPEKKLLKQIKKKLNFAPDTRINQEGEDEPNKKKKNIDYEVSSSSDKELSNRNLLADLSVGEAFVDVEQLPLEKDVNVVKLQKRDLLWVALKNKKNIKVYYVAKVETPKEGLFDGLVIYLKEFLKHKRRFVFSTATQPYPAADEDIAMVLKPLPSGGTKRPNSMFTFEHFDAYRREVLAFIVNYKLWSSLKDRVVQFIRLVWEVEPFAGKRVWYILTYYEKHKMFIKLAQDDV